MQVEPELQVHTAPTPHQHVELVRQVAVPLKTVQVDLMQVTFPWYTMQVEPTHVVAFPWCTVHVDPVHVVAFPRYTVQLVPVHVVALPLKTVH